MTWRFHGNHILTSKFSSLAVIVFVFLFLADQEMMSPAPTYTSSIFVRGPSLSVFTFSLLYTRENTMSTKELMWRSAHTRGLGSEKKTLRLNNQASSKLLLQGTCHKFRRLVISNCDCPVVCTGLGQVPPTACVHLRDSSLPTNSSTGQVPRVGRPRVTLEMKVANRH